MLDLAFLRDRIDDARRRLGARGQGAVDALNECATVDARWRQLVTEIEALKSEHNAANAAIPELKRTGTPAQFQAARDAGKLRSERIRGLETELVKVQATRDQLLLAIP